MRLAAKFRSISDPSGKFTDFVSLENSQNVFLCVCFKGCVSLVISSSISALILVLPAYIASAPWSLPFWERQIGCIQSYFQIIENTSDHVKLQNTIELFASFSILITSVLHSALHIQKLIQRNHILKFIVLFCCLARSFMFCFIHSMRATEICSSTSIAWHYTTKCLYKQHCAYNCTSMQV
jgi:hypothetical protein